MGREGTTKNPQNIICEHLNFRLIILRIKLNCQNNHPQTVKNTHISYTHPNSIQSLPILTHILIQQSCISKKTKLIKHLTIARKLQSWILIIHKGLSILQIFSGSWAENNKRSKEHGIRLSNLLKQKSQITKGSRQSK